jgi:hypothetical protein
MMNEVESWSEKGLADVDEKTVIGRLLTWIAFLRFIDSAAPKDFTIRPAFVCYLGKCGAISSILNLALVNDEAINYRKREVVPAPLELDDPFLDE